MLLRGSLLRLKRQEGHGNGLVDIVNELLALAGFQDVREFRIANSQQHGKTFENFFLRVERLSMFAA